MHTPIHTHSERLLDKYCKKLGVKRPKNPAGWKGEGQTNPYYCAMVEQLDYYMGKLFRYLESTNDPRRPGHKLIDNTYVIFTSDNGGMERVPGEIITDNYPLDRGKISLMEGGTRVPLIITGPGISAGVQSDVMVNGLDFYPTILSWVGAQKPKDKRFDGSDLSKLLDEDPTNASLVLDRDGSSRDTMVWHFPNSVALESTIRIGGYKLVRNYSHVHVPNTAELELYQLYKTENGKQVRVDIEESKNLADAQPKRAKQMNDRLTEILTEMKASYPYYNASFRGAGPNAKKIPHVRSHQQKGRKVYVAFTNNEAKVVLANLIYSVNGNARYEEWYRTPAKMNDDGQTVTALLPKGTTHFFVNLIDENNFLVSYPEVPDALTMKKTKDKYAKHAISASSVLKRSERGD